MIAFLCVPLIILNWGTPLFAQNLPPTAAVVQGPVPPRVRRTNEFVVWVGYSPHSFQLEGTSLHRQLLLLNLQFARIIGARGPLTFRYTGDVVPAAIEFQPTSYYMVRETVLKNAGGAVFGAGANPFGFQVNWGHRRIQPLASAGLGFLYFKRQVPAPASSQFNFTFNFGLGVQFFSSSSRSVILGYKYHHLSNADTGIINPGLDSNIIYVGYSFSGRKRAH